MRARVLSLLACVYRLACTCTQLFSELCGPPLLEHCSESTSQSQSMGPQGRHTHTHPRTHTLTRTRTRTRTFLYTYLSRVDCSSLDQSEGSLSAFMRLYSRLAWLRCSTWRKGGACVGGVGCGCMRCVNGCAYVRMCVCVCAR